MIAEGLRTERRPAVVDAMLETHLDAVLARGPAIVEAARHADGIGITASVDVPGSVPCSKRAGSPFSWAGGLRRSSTFGGASCRDVCAYCAQLASSVAASATI